MTKLEALQKSLEMWTWLRDQAREGKYYRKEDWFEVTKNRYVSCWCYLCEYAEEVTSVGYTCANCPIQDWEEDEYEEIFCPNPCCQETSPFLQWSKDIGQVVNHQASSNKAKKEVLEGASKMVELLEANLRDKEGRKLNRR